MPQPQRILFTAFEPSGDEHAAPVIAELMRRDPVLEIWALGGDRMARAGARLIARTTDHAAMGLGALAKIREHRRTLAGLRQWMADHPIALHVPTDSPAANWSICKLARRHGAAVLHLVAPQVWAWASWRVNRLKKWSDGVLCLLPFEPEWFSRHGVKARFIGHPLFREPLPDSAQLNADISSFPKTEKRLALLPGSRPGEIRSNWPLMLETWRQLSVKHADLGAVVVASNKQAADQLHTLTPDWPESLHMTVSSLHASLHWPQAALAVSGTVTLHIARQQVPMVTLYRAKSLPWHLLTRWLMNTGTFTLPNLLAAGGPTHDRARHIVPEFVPFLGTAENMQPVADEVEKLLLNENARQAQISAIKTILEPFSSHDAGAEAAEAICEMLRTRNIAQQA